MCRWFVASSLPTPGGRDLGKSAMDEECWSLVVETVLAALGFDATLANAVRGGGRGRTLLLRGGREIF